MLKFNYSQMINWVEDTIEDAFCGRYKERYIKYNEDGEFEFLEGNIKEGDRVVFKSKNKNFYAIGEYEIDDEGYVFTNAERKDENFKVTESKFISDAVGTYFAFKIVLPLSHDVEAMKKQGLLQKYIDEYESNVNDLDGLLHFVVMGMSKRYDDKRRINVKNYS